jgi:hypothetical protein
MWVLRDARTFPQLPESWVSMAKTWSGTRFQWTKWVRQREEWTHDHCPFCSACICDHRERYPNWRSTFRERGCFGHAFLAVDLEGSSPVWVCRSCFKALKAVGNWSILKRANVSSLGG